MYDNDGATPVAIGSGGGGGGITEESDATRAGRTPTAAEFSQSTDTGLMYYWDNLNNAWVQM